MPGGRKQFDGKDEKIIVPKLEAVFSVGGSDEEACLDAGISTSALYRYQENNSEFRERKKLLKHQPNLIARRAVVEGMKSDPNLALKYLERRKSDEFSTHTKIKVSGNIDHSPQHTPEAEELSRRYTAELRDLYAQGKVIDREVVDCGPA